MAQTKANQMVVCGNCAVPLSSELLYMCIYKTCFKNGDALCKKCGNASHRNADHPFDTKAYYVHAVTVKPVQNGIDKGRAIVKHTVAIESYHKVESMWQNSMSCAIVTGNSMVIAAHSFESGAAVAVSTAMSGTVPLIGAGVVFVGELILHTTRFMKGDITTWKEYGYYVSKGFVSASGTGLGSWGGAVGGALIGAVGSGPAAPIGALIGGIIGAIAGGLLGRYCLKKIFDRFVPGNFIQGDQQKREHLIRDALKLFGLELDDIENAEIFNERALKKKYHALARECHPNCHPDKNGNSGDSQDKFVKLGIALGVLLALLETPFAERGKVSTQFKAIRAIKWTLNAERLQKVLKAKNVGYIISDLHQWNDNVTIKMICQSQMKQNDILEMLNEYNACDEYRSIPVVDRQIFTETIQRFKEDYLQQPTDDEKSHQFQVQRQHTQSSSNTELMPLLNASTDGKEEEQLKLLLNDNEDSYEDMYENTYNESSKETKEMSELRNALKQKKVLWIAEMCEKYDEDLSLHELIQYRKVDLLEVLDDINNEEICDRRISALNKNKFAKIISQFGIKDNDTDK